MSLSGLEGLKQGAHIVGIVAMLLVRAVMSPGLAMATAGLLIGSGLVAPAVHLGVGPILLVSICLKLALAVPCVVIQAPRQHVPMMQSL